MHDERASLCFLTMIKSLLDAVAQSVERPFKGPSLVQLYRLTWVRIPWETISYYAAAWEFGTSLAAPSGCSSDMKLRSLGKQKEKIQLDRKWHQFCPTTFSPKPLISRFSAVFSKVFLSHWSKLFLLTTKNFRGRTHFRVQWCDQKKALNNHSPKMVSSRYFDSTSTTTVTTTEKNALSLSSWNTAALKRARWPRLKEQATQFDEHHISRNPLN